MIHDIIDLSPLLLCYVKSWNVSIITTLCTILRVMTSSLRTYMDFGKIIHVNLSSFMNLDHGDQMDMIILDFNLEKLLIKYPINALLVNCSFMVFREVPLYRLNLGSLVELGVSLLMVNVQNL